MGAWSSGLSLVVVSVFANFNVTTRLKPGSPCVHSHGVTSMKHRRSTIAIVLATSFVLLAAAPAAAKDKWINLATKNFNIISNADEDATRKIALKLEQFHYSFSKIFQLPLERAIKTTVMVFKTESSFNPYKPLYNGRPANVAGYFQGGEDENLIVMDITANKERPLSVVYHEYTHLLTSNTPRDWPLWLKEGLAELYSSFDIYNGMVLLGVPIPRHVSLLRRKSLIPLADLVSVRRGSPLYNERDRQGIFYAESWALCHYMMIGDSNAREARMVEYTALINQGVASDEAFARAFKSSTTEIEKLLKRYVSSNDYTGNVYKLPGIEGERDISANPISEAEVQYYLGNLLARTNRIDEAEVLLKKAIEMDPQLAGPYEGLGFVAVRRHLFDEALERFKQATQRGSKNHLAHYYYAEMLLRQVIGNVKPALAKQIGDELRAAIRLMPGFAFAHYALANLAVMTDENLKEGLDAATTAVKLEPQNKRFAFALAQLQAKTHDYAEAKKTLEPLLSPDVDPKLVESARAEMKTIEDRMRAVRVEPPPQDQKEGGGGSNISPETKQNKNDASKNALDEPPAKQPEKAAQQFSSQPTLKIEGAQSIRGVLNALECNAGKWTLLVTASNNRMRFAVSNKNKLEFFSQDPNFAGAVRCGAVNKSAFIYFKPIAAQTKLAGDAVAVEFIR